MLLSKDPNPCPWCKWPDTETKKEASTWRVCCPCGASGPRKNTEAGAVKAWDKVAR